MQGDFFLTTWFLEAMKWVYSNVNSVFLTILICTVVLRGITIFSDIATRKSQAKMNGIQPELAKIQKKYANDPQKAQMMSQKLMKERGVSMWGSCLPLLITMPLFFCFIAAFRFWGYEETIKLLVSDNVEELQVPLGKQHMAARQRPFPRHTGGQQIPCQRKGSG